MFTEGTLDSKLGLGLYWSGWTDGRIVRLEPRTIVNEPAQTSSQPQVWTVDKIAEVLWKSAVDAFVKSFLIIALGSVAIGIVSGICRDMIPTAPPGFAGKLEAESSAGVNWQAWSAPFHHHRFLFVFGLVFLPTAWTRLARRNGQQEGASRLEKLNKKLSEDWFHLIVGNAFGAMVSAMVVVWVSQFSMTKMLFGWMLDAVWAGIQDIAKHLFGSPNESNVEAWFNWYNQNQLKFTFWFLYLAAICDDLGIPNLKTLGLRLWRRIRRRIRNKASVTAYGKSPTTNGHQ
jgi:hypothetical protein